MKRKLVILVLAVLCCVCIGSTVAAFAESAENETGIPCMVTGKGVNERIGPGKRYDSVAQHKKGEIVYVADATGNWWRLTNGNYMSSKYLSPMCENDLDPDLEVIEEDTPEVAEPVVDDPDNWIVSESIADYTSGTPRLFGFVAASPGATREDVLAMVDDCVIMNTGEHYIECYQKDELTCRIDLVFAIPYAKFAVTIPGAGATYEVRYIRDVVDLVNQYSTDYAYFVVID